MIQSYHVLKYQSHRIHYEQKFKDDTMLPNYWVPKSPNPFWTKVQGGYNPTTFSRTKATGYNLEQMSRDDTILLLSWRHKSTDHFRTNVQGWYTPTATSLLLSGKVFPNNTKRVSKIFKLYLRQRICQHISNLFIGTHILELYGSLLYHISNVEIPDFYVL